MSVLFTTVYSGVALNTDLTKGVVDRFRSLPIWSPSPLLGSLIGDSARYLLGGTVIIVVGLILGFRPDAGIVGILAALGLVVVFAFGLSWVFTTLGLLLRSPLTCFVDDFDTRAYEGRSVRRLSRPSSPARVRAA